MSYVYTLENATGTPFLFNADSEEYALGIWTFQTDDPDHQNRWKQAVLLVKKDSGWNPLYLHDPIFQDVKEDIYPNPDMYAQSAVRAVNKVLEQRTGGTTLTYAEKVAAFFQTRLAVSNNLLIVK